jgi:hypothetical protein
MNMKLTRAEEVGLVAFLMTPRPSNVAAGVPPSDVALSLSRVDAKGFVDKGRYIGT